MSRVTQLGSARSLLLTVLGEFVHPNGSPVWTATLVDALQVLGVEEKAARQALTRTAAEGMLSSERHGRRVLWSLTPQGHALLEEGTRRIYGFMRERRPLGRPLAGGERADPGDAAPAAAPVAHPALVARPGQPDVRALDRHRRHQGRRGARP